MKQTLALLVSLFIAIFSASALADEIASSEIKPIAGYKNGFFIQNTDGSFRLKFNGRAQGIYYFEKKTGSEATSTFKTKTARFDFSTVLAEKGHTDVQIQHSTKSSDFSYINIYKAEAGYKFDRSFDVTLGTVGLPLGFIFSGTTTHFVDSPILYTKMDGGTAVTPLRSALTSPRGLGIKFSGDVNKFYYEANVINGASEPKKAQIATDLNGQNVTVEAASGGVESNFDLAFHKRVSIGARLAYNAMGSGVWGYMDLPYSKDPNLTFTTGVNYQGKRQDPTNDVVINRILTGSMGGAFRWRGFAVTSEIFGRKTTLADPGTTNFFSMSMDDLGYYIDSGYFVIRDKLEIAGLISQIFREGPHNNSYQFGSSLGWFISGNNLKLLLSYTLSGTYNDITNENETKKHYIGTMLQAAF